MPLGMSAADSPSPSVLDWSRSLASLSPGQAPCPGFRPEDWATTLDNCRRFVNEFGYAGRFADYTNATSIC